MRTILLICCVSFIGSFSMKSDIRPWSRFRGINGTGLEPEAKTPVSWETNEFQWKVSLPGTGNASPVAWEDLIFVSCADDEKDTGYGLAIDAEDGRILWQKEFTVTDISLHNHNKLSAACPAVDRDHVYFIWYSGEKTELFALSHDGELRWKSVFGGIKSRHGGGSSLMLTEKYVIFSREQELEHSDLQSSWVAVNKYTGKTIWEVERNSAIANSFSTPILLEKEGMQPQLVFASQAHGLTGVDLETGRILWERDSILTARVVASPLYANGKIVACRKGQTIVMDWEEESSEPADTVQYALPPSLSPYVPTPIIVEGLLYLFMDNGAVACVSLDTGELRWKERPAGPIFGSPVCVGDNLYCVTKSGEVIVIRADPEYELLAVNELGEGSFSTPAVCPAGMVFQTFNSLMLVGMD